MLKVTKLIIKETRCDDVTEYLLVNYLIIFKYIIIITHRLMIAMNKYYIKTKY